MTEAFILTALCMPSSLAFFSETKTAAAAPSTFTEHINFDMPVEVIFDDALGRKDKDGNSYISYFFKPIK